MASKFTPVTDPAEMEELIARKDELDTPTFFAPNGHLWVETEEYRAWRAARERTNGAP
jgi:hypothetical protein